MTIWLVTLILVVAMLLLISEKLPVDLTSSGSFYSHYFEPQLRAGFQPVQIFDTGFLRLDFSRHLHVDRNLHQYHHQ